MSKDSYLQQVGAAFDQGVADEMKVQPGGSVEAKPPAVGAKAYYAGFETNANEANDPEVPILKQVVLEYAGAGYDDGYSGATKKTSVTTKTALPDWYKGPASPEQDLIPLYNDSYDFGKSEANPASSHSWIWWTLGAVAAAAGVGALVLTSKKKGPLSNPSGFVVKLDNMDEREGAVLATVCGRGAAAWAKDDQSIAGSRWETDGPDFAYAMPDDHPGLVAQLEKEGYKLDLDEYSPP